VHRYHLEWSKNGTRKRITERLATAVRQMEGRDGAPSAGIVDARSVRAAATVSKKTKDFDAGKKINRRKTFGIVDILVIVDDFQVVKSCRLAIEDFRRHRGISDDILEIDGSDDYWLLATRRIVNQ
jgi:hypothetical protein